MTITLIRHAPVVADWDTRLSADELPDFIRRYDSAPIDTAPPSKDIFDIVANADRVVASPLPRAVESLGVLGFEADETDEIFAEAPLPTLGWKRLRLKPMQWLSFFRILWLLGLLKGEGSFADSKTRAQRAADRLVDLAQKHGNVVLMGHGGMNAMIAKALRRRGWKIVRKSGGIGNWSVVELEIRR